MSNTENEKGCPFDEPIHTAEISKPTSEQRILKGEFIFENGRLDFQCHTQNVEFSEVLRAITAMRDECQRQIDNQTKCPFHQNTIENEKAKSSEEVEDKVKLIVKLERIRSSTYSLFGKKAFAFEKSFLKNLNANGVFVVHTEKPLKDLQSRISELEAKVKKYEEALREIVSECKNEKSDLLNSIHKIEEIATEALNQPE